ncbi:Nucleoside transporter [Spironucleus salmonicida]|uniref:Nucleoside transporter n=1 Tax=Spironucleus salmonicida TaxID=348837 RepID=V6LDS7_9EUKA|nr:Nucleoside transporter [Spironucleus salmonicida]|eukprot:EST42418.1 Nucleoside transporter family protein [Spironucleus salmonicida]
MTENVDADIEIKQIDSQTVDAAQPELYTKVEEKPNKLAWWIFLLFGITFLIPFNCFIVPVDYWFNQFPSTLLTGISLVNNVCTAATSILMMRYSVTLTVRFRLILCWSVQLCIMLTVPFVQLITYNQKMRMAIILICCVFSGICAGIYFPTLMGLAASLDVKYIVAVNSGSGVAGMVAQLIKILTKPIIPFNSKDANYDSYLYYTTILYFAIGSLFIIASFIGYFKITKIYTTKQLEFDSQDRKRFFMQKLTKIQINDAPGSRFIDAAKNLWMPGLSLFLIFFVTLTLFPAITIQILCYSMFKTNESGKYGDWWSIIMFSWFMLGDWVGRQFPSWKWGLSFWSVKSLFIAAIIRLSFIALFIVQIVPYYHWPSGTSSPAQVGQKPDGLPLVHNDLFAWIVMILFAVSNGWFMCAIFCKYGTIMKPETNHTHAANFMTLCLNFGLVIGSSLGTIVSIIIDTAKSSL